MWKKSRSVISDIPLKKRKTEQMIGDNCTIVSKKTMIF